MPDPLSDADITARIRAGTRCQVCSAQRRPGLQLCDDHRDELARVLDPDYLGDRDAQLAASIPVLYHRLDATPATTDQAGPRAPGFGSDPPCNLDPLVFRDPRSAPGPVVPVWYDPHPSGHGDDLSSPHFEDPHPPRSVARVIGGVVSTLGGTDAGDGVESQCAWLHTRVDTLAARSDAAALYRDLIDLHGQLRPAAGDPKPVPSARCTGWVRDPRTREKVECGAGLVEPPPQPGVESGPARPPLAAADRVVLRCHRCDRPYTLMGLLRLRVGDQVDAERRAG